MRAFGEKRNPKRHRDSSSWYHPKRIIKLGYGVWVWMRYCSPTDLPEWGLQSARNNSAQNNAEVSKQRYIADRSDAFRRHSDFATLDDLERTVYGYLDAEEPHGNTSPDKT
ncbi:hypothetical protein [Streptomyces lavendulae]|uniref:hypothetical protein n=1 Tax=Streptomyces lavendulae TaxID=1914 RepID=UPI0033D1C91A